MRKFLIALLVCGLALAAGAAFSVAMYTPPVGTWRPVRPEPGFVQQAYTGQPAVKETWFYVSWLAAGPDGTLYVNQDRAEGDERSTPDATEIVMLRPDGSAGVLEEPIVDGLQVEEAYILAVGDDGTAYLHDQKNGRLVARAPDSTWRALTAAQDWTAGHDGDGGPALQAHIDPPRDAAVGPDGSVFFAEPYAVRRIAPDGIITTVAGTNAFDEEDVGFWGQGPPPRLPLVQVGPGGATTLEAFELSKAASAEAELRPQRAPKPATDTVLPELKGMNVLPDGSLVLVFRQNIRIVRPDGLMEVVAGPNEGQATDAGRILAHIVNEDALPDSTTLDGAAVGPDGAVYTKDTATGRLLRWRAADGLSLVAGSPRFSPTGDPTVEEKPASKGPMVPGEDPVPADRVSLYDAPAFLAFLPSGDLAMAEVDQVVVLGDPAALPGR